MEVEKKINAMDTEERIRATQAQRDRVHKDENEQSKNMVKEKLFGVNTSAPPASFSSSKSIPTPSVSFDNSNNTPLSGDDYVSGEMIPSKAKSLNQLLTYTTVENVLANKGNIVSLKEDNTFEDALKTFKDTEIQSVPVYDASGKYLKIVDIKDIFVYFFSTPQDDLEYFFKQPLKKIVGGSTVNTPQVPIGTSITEVTKTLASGVHHICVPDKFSDTLFNIISQLQIVQFIAKNISLMPDDLKTLPVSEFANKIVMVNTIPSDTCTREAFEYLFKDNISAAAVVDEKGRLIETLSTFDLVGVAVDRFENLESPVIDFLRATRRTKALKPPITCHMTDTLEYVITKLASTGVHRLWVVDEEAQQQYLGFANLTNVLQAVCNRLD